MNVSLTAELETFVGQLVSCGRYGSQSEVVRAGLRLLIVQEEEQLAKLEALRAKVASGFAGVSTGEEKRLDAETVRSRARSATN